jgi:hypothetical protein
MREIAKLGLLLLLGGCSFANQAAPLAPIAADLADAAADDEKCRSFGLVVGTDTYTKCRLQMEQERKPAQAPAN